MSQIQLLCPRSGRAEQEQKPHSKSTSLWDPRTHARTRHVTAYPSINRLNGNLIFTATNVWLNTPRREVRNLNDIIPPFAHLSTYMFHVHRRCLYAYAASIDVWQKCSYQNDRLEVRITKTGQCDTLLFLFKNDMTFAFARQVSSGMPKKGEQASKSCRRIEKRLQCKMLSELRSELQRIL